MKEENGQQGGSEGPENDFERRMFERSAIRSVENYGLVSGICAIVSLFLLNSLVAFIGILFAALAFSKARQLESDGSVSSGACVRLKNISAVLVVVCIVVMIADIAIGSLLSDLVSEYFAFTGGTIDDAVESLGNRTSTWG